MTLKEKFENNITESQGNIKIADEFAIGFAEWVVSNPNVNQFQYSFKDLLEQFKKEKGL